MEQQGQVDVHFDSDSWKITFQDVVRHSVSYGSFFKVAADMPPFAA